MTTHSSATSQQFNDFKRSVKSNEVRIELDKMVNEEKNNAVVGEGEGEKKKKINDDFIKRKLMQGICIKMIGDKLQILNRKQDVQEEAKVKVEENVQKQQVNKFLLYGFQDQLKNLKLNMPMAQNNNDSSPSVSGLNSNPSVPQLTNTDSQSPNPLNLLASMTSKLGGIKSPTEAAKSPDGSQAINPVIGANGKKPEITKKLS